MGDDLFAEVVVATLVATVITKTTELENMFCVARLYPCVDSMRCELCWGHMKAMHANKRKQQ